MQTSEPVPAPTLLVVYRGMKALAAVDLASGSPVDVEYAGVSRLGELSRRSGYARVVALEENALARVIEHAGREPGRGDDPVRRLAALARGFAAEWNRGIFVYPPRRARWRVPSGKVLDLACRLMVPGDSVIVFAVTERGVACASTVLLYRDGAFRALGPLTAGGWEAAVAGLVAEHGGKVRGVLVEQESLERIAGSRFPAGAVLWSVNTSGLRTYGVPLRWKVAVLAGAVVLGRKKRGSLRKRRGGTPG